MDSDKIQMFNQDGYLILRDLLAAEETAGLQRWAQEVHVRPNDEKSPWMAYAEINADGKKFLCRTENYASSHPKLNSLLRGKKILSVLRALSGEDMVLLRKKSITNWPVPEVSLPILTPRRTRMSRKFSI